MWWIIGAFALTWAVIGVLAWYGRRWTIAQDAIDCVTTRDNVKDHGALSDRFTAMAQSLDRAQVFFQETRRSLDELDVGCANDKAGIDAAIAVLRADLTASLDTYHGDRKGDRLKPWRNLPQFADLAKR